MAKRLPIGISDFKEIIDGDYAYVDKTLLIEELLNSGAKVVLIPRLRRFGKTLNLSMLRYFFEKVEEDTGGLFKNLNIWKNENYRAMQGKFPVIFITLKDIKQESWEKMVVSLQQLIAEEFRKHRYLLEEGILSDEEKIEYSQIIRKEDKEALLERSLLLLSSWLHRYHKQRVILLIDEYDTPAHAAYVGGFYQSLISFLRNWLSGGLKDNPYLERGVLTGILRIAKESIFSGLNNIQTFTLLNEGFQDKFGLLEIEVEGLLRENLLSDHLDEMRQWYNGYRIGSCEKLYNPWSVLMCIANKGALAPYWVNTSENTLMKHLITRGDAVIKEDLEELLAGKHIEKNLDDEVVFSNLEKTSNAIWSLLLFSGYLTLASVPFYGKPTQLRIPNAEIAELYKSMIAEWFEVSLSGAKYHQLLDSLVKGDIETFSQIFQEFLLSALSFFDVPSEEPEKVYHAFVLGMLLGLKDRYEVKSNRESGYGRYDVLLIPLDPKDLGIILEFKKIGPFDPSTLEEGVVSALKQIEEKRYAQELHDRHIPRILYLGLAFKGKQVLIRSKEEIIPI